MERIIGYLRNAEELENFSEYPQLSHFEWFFENYTELGGSMVYSYNRLYNIDDG